MATETDTRASVADLVRASSLVMAYLNNDSARVMATGRLRAQPPNGDNLPCVTIDEAGMTGGARYMPWFEERVNLRVYDTAASPSSASYVTIDRIIEELVRTLHAVNLDVRMSYRATWEIRFDDYISRESWDNNLKLPYRVARFCIYGAWFIY